jgi:hypothetical protein
MDREEAKRLLQDHLLAYRRRPYPELVRLIGETQVAEVQGPSGVQYQIEVEVLRDESGGRLHVLAAIDDGSLRGAFSPVCDDFFLTPDGSFGV